MKTQMDYKLYYAELNLKGEALRFSFKSWKERMFFMADKIICPQKKVFVLYINYADTEDMGSVYVFDVWFCIRFLNIKEYNSKYYTFWLREYSSYKEAYKFAMSIKNDFTL